MVRHYIRGQVPLGLFDAPQAGSGKTLLVELIGMIATGREAALMSSPSGDDEAGKRITAALTTGATIINIDKVKIVWIIPVYQLY